MVKKRDTYLWFYIEFFVFLYQSIPLVFYILNKYYYFIGYLYKSFNQDSYNSIIIFSLTIQLESIIRSFIILYWKKILFKGKSYKIKIARDSNKITLRMGFSHWTKFIFYRFYGSIYKCTRQKFIVFTPIIQNLDSLLVQISRIRPINPYTKRGLRLNQQYIRRRSGKLSQVLSSLH